ncbi:MAG: 50S ribosomal protein L35ae [Candidatus Bathyarchaeia archaeon]
MTRPELSKMRVQELRKLAEHLGIESPSKMLKADLINAIMDKERLTELSRQRPRKPTPPAERILGTFVNYRQGMFRQNTKSLLIKIEGVTSASSASKYIGRRVVWLSQTGKRLVGRVVATHGQGGVLLSRFKKGLPGQAIGATVEIV